MRRLINLVESVFEWEGRNAVWTDGTHYICVDDPQDASYVSLWAPKGDKHVRVGDLTTRRTPMAREYLSIASVDINQRYRGQGFGLKMYQALLDHLPERFAGISSYLPDAQDKGAVPAIWKRLGGTIHPQYSDLMIVDR